MAVGDKTNVSCIKDLTTVMGAMLSKTSAVLGFVGQKAVLIEPIADGDYVLAAGDTFTLVNGIIVAIVPA